MGVVFIVPSAEEGTIRSLLLILQILTRYGEV
jgi:hypothetical protein